MMRGELRRRAGVVVTTFTGNGFLVLGTLALGFLASILGWVPPRGNWMFTLGRWWARGLLLFGGVELKARGHEGLSTDQGYVFMANHESYVDIPALFRTLPGQTRFLAKASLFRIPIFGWALHAGGFVPVERADRDAARGSFDTARRRLEEGRSILVFPEGTRSRDGRLLPFRRGGFLLALKTGFPIVPVGIHGTRKVRPRGSVLNHPGPVHVSYGTPIDPAEYGLRGRRELQEAVRCAIEELRKG